MFIEAKAVKKGYGSNGQHAQVLDGIDFKVQQGEVCVILGPSGSGKSTLLNIIGGLDGADSGSLLVDGIELTALDAKGLLEYRRRSLGVVFQFYNLIPDLTVAENIEVCRYLTADPLDMDALLETCGMAEHRHKFPAQLSGGQQQRCALARALVKNPRLLLCDEPTGALDSQSAAEVMELLDSVNRQRQATMLIVTHNELVCQMAHQIVKIKDGRICEDRRNASRLAAAQIDW